MVQEAQARGAAALTALQGNAVPARRCGPGGRRAAAKARQAADRADRGRGALAAMGLLAIGSGVLLWVWYRRRSEPEWLIEPPEVQHPLNPVHPASGATASGRGGSESRDRPDEENEENEENDQQDGNGPV